MSDNVTGSYASASSYLQNPFGAIGQLDLYPIPGQLTGSAMNTAGLNGFTAWNQDFNGDNRDQTFRGAYSGEGTNPAGPRP